MSERLGPLTFGKKEEEIFLGRDIGMSRNYSEDTARAIDEEVRKLVEEQVEAAKRIVTQNRDKLERLAHALLERESLDTNMIDRILRGEVLPQLAPAQPAPTTPA